MAALAGPQLLEVCDWWFIGSSSTVALVVGAVGEGGTGVKVGAGIGVKVAPCV